MKARGIWVIVFFSSALEVVAAKIAQDILHRIQNGKEAFGACEATGFYRFAFGSCIGQYFPTQLHMGQLF